MLPSPKFLTISGDPGRVSYRILDVRKITFLQKAFSWWRGDSNSRPAAQVLPMTPFAKALNYCSPLGYVLVKG